MNFSYRNSLNFDHVKHGIYSYEQLREKMWFHVHMFNYIDLHSSKQNVLHYFSKRFFGSEYIVENRRNLPLHALPTVRG